MQETHNVRSGLSSVYRIQMLILAVAMVGTALAHDWCVSMESHGHNLVVTENDNGRRIKTQKGDTLVVKLGTQLGTGYSWQLVKTNRNLRLIGKPQIESPKEGAPGGGEVQVFLFEANRSGSSRLKLAYLRAWEKGSRPSKVFDLSVVIH